jgi:hypothetical protein
MDEICYAARSIYSCRKGDGGLVCYIGYLLAFSTLGHVFGGLTPSLTASILLSAFGAIGLGCWGVGLILPLEAVRPYIA